MCTNVFPVFVAINENKRVPFNLILLHVNDIEKKFCWFLKYKFFKLKKWCQFLRKIKFHFKAIIYFSNIKCNYKKKRNHKKLIFQIFFKKYLFSFVEWKYVSKHTKKNAIILYFSWKNSYISHVKSD